MTDFADLLWPRVQRLTAAQIEARNKEDDQDVAVIRSADWSQNTELALEEARGLACLLYTSDAADEGKGV